MTTGNDGNCAGMNLLADVSDKVADCEKLYGCGHSDPRDCLILVNKRKPMSLKIDIQQNAIKIPPIMFSFKRSSRARQQLRRRRRPQLPVSNPPPPVAQFPRRLKAMVSEKLGGESVCGLETEFELVISKKLTNTDLQAHHSRVSIPGERENAELFNSLNEEEKLELEINKKIKLRFFLDPDLEVAPADKGCCLAKWRNGKKRIFTLSGVGWKRVLDKETLRTGDWIDLFRFRALDSGELCLVMVTAETRRRAGEMGDGGGENVGYEQIQAVEQEEEEGAVGGGIESGSPAGSRSYITDFRQEEEEEEENVVIDLRLKL